MQRLTPESLRHEGDPLPFPIVGHQARRVDAELRREILTGVAIALIRETRVGLPRGADFQVGEQDPCCVDRFRSVNGERQGFPALP